MAHVFNPIPPVDLAYIDGAEWWKAMSEYETEQCDTILTLPEGHTQQNNIASHTAIPECWRPRDYWISTL